MRNGFKFIGLAAIAALSLTAMAIQDGNILKRVAKVGDVLKYRLKADLEANGQAATFTALITEKVTKVADNGDITTESTESEGKVKLGDTDMDQPGTGTETLVSSSLGKVLTITSEQPDPYRMANLQSMQFPGKALKVGDSWETEVKKDDKGSIPAKGSYKIEAQEKVGDVDAFRIKGGIKETVGEQPAGIDGTYWISVKDGSLIKMSGTFTNAPTPVGILTMKVSMTKE